MVIATDPETGETAEKQVKNTFVNETEELAHVFVDDEEIVCTPGHKFYAPEKGWTSAIKLRAGDHLQLVNGEYVTVEKVQHELLEEPVKVYNFEVEDFHTYYVGFGNQVLVHNKCSTDTPLTWNEFQHVNKGKYTKQEMSEAWAKYKELNYPKTVVKNTADSTVLRKNMIKDGIQVPEYKNDAHHIVAGNAEGANEARAILEKYGVGINDSANGVFLPSQESMSEAAYHKTLHTTEYYNRVNELLRNAESKYDVIETLDYIREALITGSDF